MKCHLHVGLPVHGELEPALLVQRRGGRRCASTEHEDVRLQHVEHCGRRAGLCRIERQSLDAPNIHGELSKPGLLPCYCKYARPVAPPPPPRFAPPRSPLFRPAPPLPPITTMVLPFSGSICPPDF